MLRKTHTAGSRVSAECGVKTAARVLCRRLSVVVVVVFGVVVEISTTSSLSHDDYDTCNMPYSGSKSDSDTTSSLLEYVLVYCTTVVAFCVCAGLFVCCSFPRRFAEWRNSPVLCFTICSLLLLLPLLLLHAAHAPLTHK